MSGILKLLINALAVFTAAYIIPGVSVDGFIAALIVAIVLGILNAIVKPLLIIITIPITILTLGLFLIVINVLVVLLADGLVDGFHVSGFWSALLFSLATSLVSSFLEKPDKNKNTTT